MIEELVKQVNSLQKQIDALVKPETGRWLDWTPTLTQGAAITITITYARYIVTEKTVTTMGLLAATSAGTAANVMQIGNIPTIITPKNTGIYAAIGVFLYFDTGSATPHYNAILTAQSSTTFRALGDASTSWFGQSPAITIANGDQIGFLATYERL